MDNAIVSLEALESLNRGLLGEIAERRQAEASLRESRARLARELDDARQLEKIGAQLAEDDNGGSNLEQSLGVLVRTAVAHLGEGTRCAFFSLNRDETGICHIVGMPEAYAECVRAVTIGADSFACGLAAHSRSPVTTADVREEPLWSEWVWLAERFGFRGCWSFPVLAGGRTVGTMAFYFDAPREATARDHEYAAVLTRAAALVLTRDREKTERARAEEALRQSEEKYRTLFDSIDEGLAIVEVIRDAAGRTVDVRFVDVNAVFERQTGLKDVRGKLRSEKAPPADPAWLEDLGEVARSGEPKRLERYNTQLERWYRVYVSRVGGAGSSQVAIVFEDISERKVRERKEALLAEVSHALAGFETIAGTMPLVGEKIARHFDLAWCTFVELSEDQEHTVASYGWRAADAAPLDGPYRMRDFLSDELLAAHLLGEPVLISDTRKDPRVRAATFGELGIVSAFIVPLVREGTCRFQLAILDRQPRLFESDEVELMQELTQRIWIRLERARTEEALRHSEARLRTVAAELQEADQRKNDFLAMLGHELRNPLAAIGGGLKLLRSEKARPESREAALPIVAGQVAHMERLVDDLLDLTRIVQGRVQVRREPMALQEALRQALEMVRTQAETGAFEIEVHAASDPLEIHGDPVRLTQVFMNVLGNALKYSGDSRRIEVAATRDGNAAVVRVRDYGLGISAELLPRIYEPFVQARPGLTLQAGLGLGLAVVRQLVHLHEGQIDAFSEGEGQGSEFVLRFPLSQAA